MYKVDDDIYTEKERLEIIKRFMYTFPEVQHVHFYKTEDIKNKKIISRDAWAIKAADIKRFDLDEKEFENEYICDFERKNCAYFSLYSSNDKDFNEESYLDVRAKFFEEKIEELKNNDMFAEGEIMEMDVDSIGKMRTSLICIPLKKT